MSRRLTAAIVGLGQVGMLFDDDSKRRGVWTHFTAYEKLKDRFDLVAVCDPDASRLKKAVKRRSVRTYRSLGDLLRMETIDVLSLCTPPAFHAAQINAAAGRVKAIVCEKPLGDRLASARHAVVECRRKKTALTINYYKRFEAGIQHLKSRAKRIGPVHTVIGTYTGPFDAVGSHMVDTLRYLFGDLSVAYSDGSTAVLKGANGLKAILNQAGQREDFIFELDAIGKNGRYLLADNFQTVEAKVFVKSPRYGGYRELVRTKNPLLRPADRFLPMFKEIHAAALNGKAALTCSGADALKTQELMDVIARGKRK